MSISTKKNQMRGLYFGWWMTIVTSIYYSIVSALLAQGSTIIFKPISADLGLSRAATSVAMGIGALQSGIFFPLGGWLSDKFGSRWLVIAGCLMSGIGMFMMNYINSTWAYYVAWGILLSGGNSLGFSVVIDKLITNWFIKKRGLAFSVRFALIGVIGMASLPIISMLVVYYGWRTTNLLWSICAFFGIPIAFFFVRQHRPEHYGLLPDGAITEKQEDIAIKSTEYAAEAQEEEFALGQALKTPTYWLLTMVWILYNIVYGGINVHLIPILTDIGIEAIAAGGLVAMMMFFSLPSRFFGSLVADRLPKDNIKYLMAGSLAIMALGIWSFLLPEFRYKIHLFLIFFGFGVGPFIPLDIMIRSRYYGRKAYGAIQGISMAFSAPVSFAAPIFSGWVFDISGSYRVAFIIYGMAATLSALIMCVMKTPKLKSIASR